MLSFRKNKVVSLLKTDTGKLTMRLLNGVTLTYGHKKKEYRRTPTFVNLKSNTMKNTMQR